MMFTRLGDAGYVKGFKMSYEEFCMYYGYLGFALNAAIFDYRYRWQESDDLLMIAKGAWSVSCFSRRLHPYKFVIIYRHGNLV